MCESNVHPEVHEVNVPHPTGGRNTQRRYKKKTFPDTYMSTEEKVSQCEKLIDDMLSMRQEQDHLDELYDAFVEMHHQEMATFMNL